MIIGLFCILLHFSNSVCAQEEKKKRYFVNVQMNYGEQRKGILKAIDGSNLIIKEKDADALLSISASDILRIRIRKVNAGRRIIKGAGIIVGATAGAVLGYIIGSTSEPDCEDGSCIDWGPELRGIGGGLVGAVFGGAGGSFLGNYGKKYVIDGSPENFEEMKMQLTK